MAQQIILSVAEAFSLHAAVMRELDKARAKAARIEGPAGLRMKRAEIEMVRSHLARLEALLPRICAAGREEAPAPEGAE